MCSSDLAAYWDPERKFVDENYTTIPFPFKEIDAPKFRITARWTSDQLIGYLNSWSSVQNYMRKHQRNPVDVIQQKIKSAWRNGEVVEVKFPLFIRIGRIEKSTTHT